MEFLIYGANGYTGGLIARLAVEGGLRPVLAGRDGEKVGRVAAELGLEHSVFALEDQAAVDNALKEAAVVLHCAGPFSRTSRPMADGCLRTGAHYLDITGEIAVFEALAARDREARGADVMLLPGVGFDVVPSDCLAAHLKSRLPSAKHLALGIHGLTRLSRGTATTMVENVNRGGLVRRGGRLTGVPAAWKTREIDFGSGPRTATTIPWGDVATAFYSTGIPDIETYAAVPASMRRMMVASRWLGPVLATKPVQRFLKARIKAQPPGPSEEERAAGKSFVWGEVTDDEGRKKVSRLSGPEGYTLTALAALAVVRRVLAGKFSPGFKTPSLAYGADLVLEVEGVVREDLD
ncbi:MAG TPA: saccharopine dehydrogenase NADP-binding domain-containing protein [Pyrinomonadaceae bacterium]|jgi:short subunit dehydrogenase-like uncharacterized protein